MHSEGSGLVVSHTLTALGLPQFESCCSSVLYNVGPGNGLSNGNQVSSALTARKQDSILPFYLGLPSLAWLRGYPELQGQKIVT